MKKFLLSLLLVVGSIAVQAAEVKQEQVVLSDNTTFTSQMVDHATSLVESTVNIIATPFLSDRDVECLARNIFYESGAEPTEGKIAVGLVTVNRAQDPRFGHSVCEVVKARTVVARTRQVQKTEMVRVGYFGRPEPVTRTTEVIQQVPVCQFSWVCSGIAKKPSADDERWVESRAIAEGIARGDYDEYRDKYGSALFFHNTGVRPIWAKTKQFIARTGHHLFYE
jgi:spore germination cell wall hydrolase CwlJ-like protein